MFGIGDALQNGIKGYREAESDINARNDRQYAEQKRQTEDDYTQGRRDRQGVLDTRQDDEYALKKADAARISALRGTWDSYAKGKATGDMSSLVEYMQMYDNKDDADIVNVQYANGKLNLLFDDESTLSLDDKQFQESLKMQFSPDNWMKMQDEKEMLGLKTDAQKSVNKDSAGLKTPEVVKTYDENGLLIQDTYQSGKKIGETQKGIDPAMIKSANAKKGENGSPTEIQTANFFQSFAAKAYGSEGTGGIMIPEGSRINAANIAEIGNYIYQKGDGNITLNSAAAKALRFIESAQVMDMADAKAKLEEQGVNKPGFFADDKEEILYNDRVQSLINASKDPLGSNGLNATSPAQAQAAAPAAPAAPAKQQANKQAKPEKMVNITKDVPSTFSAKMTVGKTYSPQGGKYKGQKIVKNKDGTIQLIN